MTFKKNAGRVYYSTGFFHFQNKNLCLLKLSVYIHPCVHIYSSQSDHDYDLSSLLFFLCTVQCFFVAGQWLVKNLGNFYAPLLPPIYGNSFFSPVHWLLDWLPLAASIYYTLLLFQSSLENNNNHNKLQSE